MAKYLSMVTERVIKTEPTRPMCATPKLQWRKIVYVTSSKDDLFWVLKLVFDNKSDLVCQSIGSSIRQS